MTEQAALRRHMLTDGALGAVPDWYLLDRAAKRYGVGPWEFLERPAAFLQWANTAINAENEAAEAKRQQEEGAS